MRYVGGAIGAALGLTLLSLGSSAFAAPTFGNPISAGPGTVSVSNAGGNVPGAGAVLAAPVITGSFTGAGFGGAIINGTYISEVYRELSGKLDFYYQFTNDSNPGNTSSISNFGVSNFAPVNSGVGYTTSAVGSTVVSSTLNAPDGASDVSSSGGALTTINFDFGSNGGQAIGAGATSATIFVSTDGTSFALSNGTFTGSATGNSSAGVYAPVLGAVTAPEPGALALIIPGMLGVAGMVRRRKAA